MLASNGCDTFCYAIARICILCFEAAFRAIIHNTEDSNTALEGATLEERQGRQATSVGEATPAAIAIKASRSILFCLSGKHLSVKELLQTLVAVVYQELFKPIGRKYFKSVQVQQAEPPRGLLPRRCHATCHKTGKPTEKRSIK